MVHVRALPGTPHHNLKMSEIIDQAIEESLMLQAEGVDAILLENMHDRPYLKNSAPPEIIAGMTAVAKSVKKSVCIPVGIQVLAAANKEALAIALISELSFVRAEGFVYGHLADEGYIDGCAGPLMRYRRSIGAEHIAIYTDIKKKHASHAVTSDIDIGQSAVTAQFFLSDGVVLTGGHTGDAVNLDDLTKVRAATDLPIIIGSGANIDNIEVHFPWVDAFIVGSHFKSKGLWSECIDPNRVKRFMQKIEEMRGAE